MLAFLLGLLLVGLVGSSPTETGEDVQIVGGEDIDITEAPYQVSVMLEGNHICGGSILSKDIVITAAHCIKGLAPHNFQIRAGSTSKTEGGQVIDVKDMAYNPDYNTFFKFDGDVAVFWLTKPLVFNDAVQPIPMFNAGEEIKDGELTAVTGWGETMNGSPDNLQRAMIPKVSSEECSKDYEKIHMKITSTMLCAGAPEGGVDSCSGDSGGPLVYNGKLAGIVSWGSKCALPHYPGVYAKVSALRSWIDSQIKNLRGRNMI